MEHLPTHRVDAALNNIRKIANHGAVFMICTRADRGGKKIGQTLHMTVQPPKWWVRKIGERMGGTVELLKVHTGEYCIVMVTL